MKHKSYPKYKDSGVQWIGEIPEGWNVRKVSDFLDVRGRVGWKGLSSSDYVDEGYPLFTSYNVYEYKLTNFNSKRKLKYIPLWRYEESPEIKVKENDLLLAKIGGRIGFVDKLEQKSTINSSLLILRTKSKKILHKFSFYIFNSDCFFSYFDFSKSGSTMESVDQEDIKKMKINIPSMNEQKNIIEFLDYKVTDLNSLIEKDKQLIELLKEKRTALINHVVTKGLDKNAEMKDSKIDWIGEIPEGWEVKKLKHLTSKIGSGITPTGGSLIYQDEGTPIVRSQNVHFDGLRLDDVAHIPEDIFLTMTNAIVKKHDVLLNITGASIGRTTFLEDEFEKGVVNQHVCIIRPKKINYKFLNYLLMSDFGQDQIFSLQMGSSREGLNFQQLETFTIITPKKETQIQIVQYLDKETSKIDKIIKKIEEKINLMEEYKKSLIYHVVTGKVDVRGEV